MSSLHCDDMLKAMKDILGSAKYSDLTIVCGSREFKVHRSVVCPRSRFFAAACDGEFLEAKTGKIVLSGDDLDTVKRMISYLYTLDYDDKEHFDANETDDSAESSATNTVAEATNEQVRAKERPCLTGGEGRALFSSVRVYAIAEKYDIPALKELAKERFSKWAQSHWAHEEFPDIIREVFQSTPSSDRGLRDVVSQVCVKNVKRFVQEEKLFDGTEDFGDLWLQVLRQVLKDKEAQMEKVLLDKREELAATLAGNKEKVQKEKEIKTVLQKEVTQLKLKINCLGKKISDLNDQRDALVRDVDRMINELEKKVNDMEKCSHCRVGFNVLLEDVSNSNFAVKCRKCKTKHHV